MSDGITINERQLKKLHGYLKHTPDNLFNKDTLELIADQQKNRIFTRTTGGKDTSGNPFKPYNANYALKAKKTSVNDVNLTDTGLMLNTMSQRATDTEAEIYFIDGDAEKLASYHDKLGAGKNKIIRKFFGMSSEDKDKIMNSYVQETSKRLEKLGYE